MRENVYYGNEKQRCPVLSLIGSFPFKLSVETYV